MAMGFTLTRALEWWWRECPDDICLHLDDETLTYEQMWMWTGRVGERLLGMGVRAGDRVAICSANSMDFVILTYGLIRIGAIPAPMSLRSPPRELREEMETFDPILAFVDEPRRAVMAEALGEAGAGRLHPLASMRELQHGSVPTITHEPDPDDVAFIVSTSGSTAKPKRVIYTHRTVMAYGLEFLVMQPRCGHGAKVLSMGPFSSTSGYLLMLEFQAIGIEMFIESQFIPERALKILVDEKITVMSLEGEAGSVITFSDVLMVEKDGAAQIGAPFVAGASVKAEIVEQTRGPKVISFKKRRRQNSKRKRGHRQDLTIVQIKAIHG